MQQTDIITDTTCTKGQETEKNNHTALFVGFYEFSPEFTAEGATNRSGAANLGYYSHYAASFLRHLEMFGRLQYYESS